MNLRAYLCGGAIGLAGALVGQLAALPAPVDADGGPEGAIGPDVIVGALPAIQKWGSVDGVTAYSVATTSCNVGDQQLDWVQGTNQHPVIPQNMYRLKDGRFEQVGMSWLKHGFCAIQGSLCGSCSPAGQGCINKLGIGCSDPYDAMLNGTQNNLGPRSQVDPSTGVFPYPFTAPPPPATIGRRLQVANDDLDPALNDGAQYFCEALYIHPDDAAAENDTNNASHRQVVVGTFSAGGYNLVATGPTFQQQPAILAWQAAHPDVSIVAVDVPNDGRVLVGSRATDLGAGLWQYEYAIFNMNSNRAVEGFALPVPAGLSIGGEGFKDIHHHSGEPYDTTDWTISTAPGTLSWSALATSPVDNTNALRWGTLYNFWFHANTPPMSATATLDLFKPGEPATAEATVLVPRPPCATADLDCDGDVDAGDMSALIAAWGTDGADLDGDGQTDGGDLGLLLAAWEA